MVSSDRRLTGKGGGAEKLKRKTTWPTGLRGGKFFTLGKEVPILYLNGVNMFEYLKRVLPPPARKLIIPAYNYLKYDKSQKKLPKLYQADYSNIHLTKESENAITLVTKMGRYIRRRVQ